MLWDLRYTRIKEKGCNKIAILCSGVTNNLKKKGKHGLGFVVYPNTHKHILAVAICSKANSTERGNRVNNKYAGIWPLTMHFKYR